MVLDTREFSADGAIKGPRPNETSNKIKVLFHCNEACPMQCKNNSRFQVLDDRKENHLEYISDVSVSLECERKYSTKKSIFSILIIL